MQIVRNYVIRSFVILSAAIGLAQNSSTHRAYLHGLADLRNARAHLNRVTPSGRVDEDEQRAIAEIDKAMWEIKNAAIDDGKDVNDHPAIDPQMGRLARLHKVSEILDKLHEEITREEDASFAHGLRDRVVQHIDLTHRIVDRMIAHGPQRYKDKAGTQFSVDLHLFSNGYRELSK